MEETEMMEMEMILGAIPRDGECVGRIVLVVRSLAFGGLLESRRSDCRQD